MSHLCHRNPSHNFLPYCRMTAFLTGKRVIVQEHEWARSSSKGEQGGGGKLQGQHLDLAAGKRVNECLADQWMKSAAEFSHWLTQSHGGVWWSSINAVWSSTPDDKSLCPAEAITLHCFWQTSSSRVSELHTAGVDEILNQKSNAGKS